MKRTLTLFFIIVILAGFRLVLTNNSFSEFRKPANFPSPSYNFDNNQITEAGFDLGKKLFYDPILSGNNKISCGSCHKQQFAFADSGYAISPGADNRLGTRNSPPIMNLAWSNNFFWDGGVDNLDLQPVVPITSHVEMDENIDSVIAKLKNHSAYPAMFKKTFGTGQITSSRMMKALSQFMVMCISSNSKYDRVMRKEGVSFSEEEIKGYRLVQQKCTPCHAEPLFTDNSFRNNGLPPGKYMDEGRFVISKQVGDKYKFKVPSLRNLTYTAPYMHDGRFNTLDKVADHYTGGMFRFGNLDSIFFMGPGLGIRLNSQEKKQLLTFLRTLDDPEFLNNKGLSKEK